MSLSCGSQVILCNLPIRLDTYRGCSHNCKYCFARRNSDINIIRKGNTLEALKNFVEGKRNAETNWCDWNIPIHWGGMSDPFQPIERKYRYSLEFLKYLKETQYPFIVSTKGYLVAEPEYLNLLSDCNCVVQISMLCSKYDVIEKGAPTFEERLMMVKKLSPRVKRVIIRCQPYMLEVFNDVIKNIPRMADAGAYGIVFEGMKFLKKKSHMVKIGGDYCYPVKILKEHFQKLRDECHKYGLKFYSGENRLRIMGDSMTCCGIDGLEGFVANEYNICMMLNNKVNKNNMPTEKMKEIGTAQCFSSLHQNAGIHSILKCNSFAGRMQKEMNCRKDYYKKLFTPHE